MKVNPKDWKFNELRVQKPLNKKPVPVSLKILEQASRLFKDVTCIDWDIHNGTLSESICPIKQLKKHRDTSIKIALLSVESS